MSLLFTYYQDLTDNDSDNWSSQLAHGYRQVALSASHTKACIKFKFISRPSPDLPFRISSPLYWQLCSSADTQVFRIPSSWTKCSGQCSFSVLPGCSCLEPSPCFCPSFYLWQFFLNLSLKHFTFLLWKTFSSLPLPWDISVCVVCTESWKCVHLENVWALRIYWWQFTPMRFFK